MRVKKKLLPENNYFCELGYCCVMAQEFVKNYCKGDVNNLFDFSFLKIIGDEKFGDISKSGGKKRSACVANTKIAKAIYFILLGEMLPNLSVEDLFEKSIHYKGVYLNKFSTLFSEDYSLKTINNIFCEDVFTDFREKIFHFYHKCNTIGNFLLLPEIRTTKGEKINKNYELSDFNNFFNLFLKELNKVFENSDEKDANLAQLIKENDFYFNSYYVDMNIKDFCNINFVKDYTTDEFFTSAIFKNPLTFSDINQKIDDKQKTEYVKFATEYMNKIEKIIDKRTQYIVSVLKDKLNYSIKKV